MVDLTNASMFAAALAWAVLTSIVALHRVLRIVATAQTPWPGFALAVAEAGATTRMTAPTPITIDFGHRISLTKQRLRVLDAWLIAFWPLLLGLGWAILVRLFWSQLVVDPAFFATVAGAFPIFAALLFAAITLPWRDWTATGSGSPARTEVVDFDELLERYRRHFSRDGLPDDKIRELVAREPARFTAWLNYQTAVDEEARAEHWRLYLIETVRLDGLVAREDAERLGRAARPARLVLVSVLVWNLVGLMAALVLVAAGSTSTEAAALLLGLFMCQIFALGLVVVVNHFDHVRGLTGANAERGYLDTRKQPAGETPQRSTGFLSSRGRRGRRKNGSEPRRSCRWKRMALTTGSKGRRRDHIGTCGAAGRLPR